jgi:hypothetical protein
MPKNPTIPRGIQLCQWKNTDGTNTTKYRVRIKRADYKDNKYFDNLKEAISFLQLSKLEKGKELLYSISEEERQQEKRESLEAQRGKNCNCSAAGRLYGIAGKSTP